MISSLQKLSIVTVVLFSFLLILQIDAGNEKREQPITSITPKESRNHLLKDRKIDQLPKIDPASVDVNNLYTFTCELTVKRPKELIRTCADGGMLVRDIKWSAWSPYGATGTAIYSENLCNPSCAEGSRMEIPVKISLGTLLQWKGKFYLVNLEVTPVNPGKVPPQLSPVGWDVSEFAIMEN